MSNQEKIREKRNQELVFRLRSVILSEKRVAIAGWRDSNHNDFTRSIPEHMVVFWDQAPKNIPKNVEYVIFTKFVKHKQTNRTKIQTHIHPGVVKLGQIRDVLKECLKT